LVLDDAAELGLADGVMIVALVLGYHDAIYDIGRDDNEDRPQRRRPVGARQALLNGSMFHASQGAHSGRNEPGANVAAELDRL
jgi:hypothetical protein